MTAPRCAFDGCDEPVTVALDFRGSFLAFACGLDHLRQVMHATRHLGEERVIRHLIHPPPRLPCPTCGSLDYPEGP